jgi:hypothetical protein
MVRCIFVKICEAEQQFEHAIALFRFWIANALFQVIHDRQCIRQQPFESLGFDLVAVAASLHRLAGAQKGLIEKMIQAHVLASEAGRNEICAGLPPTNPGNVGIHIPF